MTYVATSRLGKRLEARMEPWLDSEGDLARLLDAMGYMFQPLLELAEEEGEDGTPGYVPAYGTLLNPNTCPAKDLPYLGQFVGVEVPSGATEAEARKAVKEEAGLARGTKASVEAAIRKTLANAEPSFPSLAATDTFTRADENPLSNAGKWSVLKWAGAATTGQVLSNAWQPTTVTASAYWNAAKQTNPAVSLEVQEPATELRLFSCVDAASPTQGYQLVCTPSLNRTDLLRTFAPSSATLIARGANVALGAGDSVGLSVRGGKVTGWAKKSGVWSRIIEAEDNTYSTGFAGAQFVGGSFKNFGLGEMPAASEGFTVKEREPTPYSFQVFVGPGAVSQALYNAINAVIPAGLWYTINEVEDPWSLVAAGKKWSEVKAGLKWTEAKAGEP